MNIIKTNSKTIIEALQQGKKVFVNGFDWEVKQIGKVFQIVSVETGKIFCPLLNKDNKLILDHAKYIVI